MAYIAILGYAQLVLSVVFQSVVVSLQIGAFRRHRHISFALLAISTGFGIAYLLVAVALLFVRTPTTYAVFLFVEFLLFLVQGGVGLFGLTSLFRSYRKLAENPTQPI